jgi:hypothetical protein
MITRLIYSLKYFLIDGTFDIPPPPQYYLLNGTLHVWVVIDLVAKYRRKAGDLQCRYKAL